jgi:hypothetical protein
MDDLRALPKGAEIVTPAKDPKNLDLLRRADRLVAVHSLATTSAIVHALSHVPTPRMTFLIKLELPDGDLRMLGGCLKLEHLSLCIGRKLTNLGFLSELEKRRAHFLSDVPRIEFSTLPPLPSLREFVFHGAFTGK